MAKYALLVVLLGAILVSLALNAPHFNKDILGMHAWRQSQTNANALNFLNVGNNILRPRQSNTGAERKVYRSEFPLYPWLSAQVYSIVGTTPWVMRGFAFGLSVLTIPGMYY